MIIDGNDSILDNISLNKGRFETYISVGLRKNEILTAFNVEVEEMDKWCAENYNGHSFNTVYEIIRQNVRGEYLDCLKDLSIKGNPTAMSIIDRMMEKDEGDNANGMVFNVNVRVESEHDKEC